MSFSEVTMSMRILFLISIVMLCNFYEFFKALHFVNINMKKTLHLSEKA